MPGTSVESNGGMLGCNKLTLNCQPVSCWRKDQAFVKPLVMAAHTQWAGDTRSHAVNSDQKTSRYTAKIDLGPETVTQTDGLLPTEVPLKLTLIYPVTGHDATVCLHGGSAALPDLCGLAKSGPQYLQQLRVHVVQRGGCSHAG